MQLRRPCLGLFIKLQRTAVFVDVMNECAVQISIKHMNVELSGLQDAKLWFSLLSALHFFDLNYYLQHLHLNMLLYCIEAPSKLFEISLFLCISFDSNLMFIWKLEKKKS